MAWNSNQYLKFANERTQPCLDLINKLDGNYDYILDLGCGPGNSSFELNQAFPAAEITGFEADENMLKKAKEDHPDLKFVQGFAPNDFYKLDRKFDLVFSNACIHWINEQEKLINDVSAVLSENGVFAVQIPLTDESVFYKILYDLINENWVQLKSVKNFHNLNQTDYYHLLIKKFKKVSIWKTDYYHILDNKEMIIEWYKGSGLRPYLEILSKTEQDDFLCDLQKKVEKHFNLLEDGKCFLVMPRLFFIAKKQKDTPRVFSARG